MKTKILLFTVLLSSLSQRTNSKLNRKQFPKDFLFGTATSAYQVEGAWNLNGKGENIWDLVTHEHPDLILDGSSGDIACDSYHKIQEDVALLRELGGGFYRFSLSWSRILPRGLDYKINSHGIRYYNELIDTLLQNNIIPMVTLFHFDTPRSLHDMGGFTNELMVKWFENYARVAFEHFGDRVKWWLTFNEPRQLCVRGYDGRNRISYNISGTADYLCGHTVLKAHARVYHLYNQTYRQLQNGTVSIPLNSRWSVAKTSSREDTDAAERLLQFELGWFANPIFHPDGDYPDVMKTIIAERSKKEGFQESRLPVFTQKEIDYIKGTYDFFAINHYFTNWVENAKDEVYENPSYEKDSRINFGFDDTWPSRPQSISKVNPRGFRNLLNWIKDKYGDPEIYVTESGYNDNGQLNDQGRTNYYKLYLSALLDAIYEDKVNVKGYTVWSLLDNFEWFRGYTTQYGIHNVDFNDPERKRTPKASASYLRRVFANRRLV